MADALGSQVTRSGQVENERKHRLEDFSLGHVSLAGCRSYLAWTTATCKTAKTTRGARVLGNH